MGFLQWLHRDDVSGTKVLVSAIGSDFNHLLERDRAPYKQFYPSTTSCTFFRSPDLVDALKQRYDIVHVFTKVHPTGALGDDSANTTGSDLIRACRLTDVKVLWVASENEPQDYITGFQTRERASTW
jgi:hypothetical protein